MSSFSDFIPCIHGGLASTCEICTGAKKLLIRYHPNEGWQMYGFIKGSSPTRWKWINITFGQATSMLNSGKFVRIDYHSSLGLKEGQYAA